MDLSNSCAPTDAKSYRRRSVIRRLWESYALELITILELANKGKVHQRVAQEAIDELIPAMKQLRDDGEFEKILHKADVVILDKVFNDVSGENQISNIKN